MKITKLVFIIICLIFFISIDSVFSTDRYQLITDAEYFINTDPGLGKGIPIKISKGFSVDINVDNIPYKDGDIIFVRVKNEKGVWSTPYGRKLGQNYIAEAKVFKVTYPVQNYRKLIEIRANIENQKLNGLIASAVSDPIEGDNIKPGDTLLVQFKGTNGVWGPQYQVILGKTDLQLKNPIQLKAENIGTSTPKVKLTWKDNTDGESEFSIERTKLSSIVKEDDFLVNWEEIARVPKNTTEFIDETLERNKLYQWRVRALGSKNWMHSEYSNVVDLLVTKINDEILVNNLLVYPNPASDYIEINLDNVILSEAKNPIQIYNTYGECVMTESIQPMTTSHRINIENLPAGIYLVRIGQQTAMFVKI